MMSIEFEFVVGVNPGYGHSNEEGSPVDAVTRRWLDAADQVFNDEGVYVAAVVRPGKVHYRQEWGCPLGGEDVVVVTGVCNPEFIVGQGQAVWRAAVRIICSKVRKALGQSTASLVMREVDFTYLKE